MYKTVILISLIFSCGGFDPFEAIMNIISRKQLPVPDTDNSLTVKLNYSDIYKPPKDPNINNSHFCPVDNVQRLANLTDEDHYPWIARVYHSPSENMPYICTAAAIQEAVFITAARCIATAKVPFTTVVYQMKRLDTRAFVLPSKPSKQMFDDIGLIVVHNPDRDIWKTIKLIGKPRTDEHFLWFETWGLWQAENTVIGYVVDSHNPALQNLYKLESMSVSNFLCNKLMPSTPTNDSNDYFVPCYHYRTLNDKDLLQDDASTGRYLSGLGHIVFDNNTNLIGIASWACYNDLPDRRFLPVGIAVPNSESYYEDLDCALKIREALANTSENGYYQRLCDQK